MKKLILFLLLSTLAYSQPGNLWPKSVQWWHLSDDARDSLWAKFFSDTVNAKIGDSLDALSGYNGVVYSGAGRSFGQKIIKDTLALKQYASDSTSVVVNLKQLSSTNALGGGLFVLLDSAATRTAYGAGIVGSWVSYQSGTAGKRWFLKDALDRKALNPYMFGAKGDNSNDDGEEIQACIDACQSLDLPFNWKEGIFKYTTTPTFTLGFNESVLISGAGAGSGANARTRLMPSGCTGLWVKSNVTHGNVITLKDFKVFRDTTTTARADTGILIEDMESSILEGISVEGFNCGIRQDGSGHMQLRNIQLGRNLIGFQQTTHADGINFVGGQISQNDSIGISLSNSWGTIINSTEISHQKIHLELVTNTDVTLIGGRYENADSVSFLLKGASKLRVFGSSITAGTGDKIISKATGSNNFLHFFMPDIQDFSSSDSNIIIPSISTPVTAEFAQSGTANPLIVSNVDNGMKWRPTPFIGGIASSGVTASSTNNGRIFQMHNGLGAFNVPSQLIFIQETSEGVYFARRLTDGNDIRFRDNVAKVDTANFSRSSTHRRIAVNREITLAADSVTADTVYTDHYNTNTDYNCQITVSAGTGTKGPITGRVISWDRTTGECIYWLEHQYERGGGDAVKVYITWDYAAKAWDY